MSDSDLKFSKVSDVEPGKQEITLIIKVIKVEVTTWQAEKGDNFFGQGGDETGVINFNFRGKHHDIVKEGQTIVLKKVNCQVYDSKMRLIDIHNQSNVSKSATQIATVNTANDVSQDEYELLPQEGDKQNRNRDRKRNNNNNNNNNGQRNQGSDVRKFKSDNRDNRDNNERPRYNRDNRDNNERPRYNRDNRDYRDNRDNRDNNERPRYNDRRDGGDNGKSRDRRDNRDNRDNNDRPRYNERRDNERPRYNERRDNDRSGASNSRDVDRPRNNDRSYNDRPRNNDRSYNDRPRNNDRRDNDRPRNNDSRENKPRDEPRRQNRERRSQSQRRRKERDINENDNTHLKQINTLVPHPDDFITVEAKIHQISEQDPKGIRGVIGDATGTVNFYIIKDAIPEGVELKEGDVIRIVEGKCKVYDEHAYISVAGGILRRVENVTITVNETYSASKDVYGKITIDEKGGERKESTSGRDNRRSRSQPRNPEQRERREKRDDRRNDESGELKKPEFIPISSIPKKRRAFNLKAKVVQLETKDKRPRGQGNDTKAFVGKLADASGVFDFYFRADQLPKERNEVSVGDVLEIRNASQRQFKIDRRWYVYIDMFGKVSFSDEQVDANDKGQDYSIDSRDN